MVNYISDILEKNKFYKNDAATAYFIERDAELFRNLYDEFPGYIINENFIVDKRYRNTLQEMMSVKNDEITDKIVDKHLKLISKGNKKLSKVDRISAMRKIDGLFFINHLYKRVLNNRIGYPYKLTTSFVQRNGQTGQSDVRLVTNGNDLINVIMDYYNEFFGRLTGEGSIYDETYVDDKGGIFNFMVSTMHISISKFQNRRMNGRFWHPEFDKFVLLPKDFSQRVINPLNEDKYCFFYSIYMNQFYDKKEKMLMNYWKKYSDKAKELVEANKHKFDEFYDAEDKFIFSKKNIQKIEDVMGVNVHVYATHNKNLVCFFRSEFRNGTDIIRIIYFPYADMEFSAASARSKKKTMKIKEDYGVETEQEELKDHFEHLTKNNNGHFCLIPNPIAFFNQGSNIHDVCRYCDNVSANDIANHEQICKSDRKSVV